MEGTKRRGKDAQKAIVKACKRYIETHLDEDITNDILAEKYDLPPRTLWRYFKNIGNYSVPEYIRLRKVHMAARWLRHGKSVKDARESSYFQSKTHFAEAFTEYYGISPWRFRKTRGMELMTEPRIMRRPEFHIVGYIFVGTELIDWEDSGAYYIIQDFPKVPPREWARIGGGADMIGTWMEKNDTHYYIFGPGVKEVRYVPKLLDTLYVPGGLFAVFPVEKPKDPEDSTVLCENVQVTWFYALKQWIPASEYEVDETRIPYEYYLDGENSVCVPIVPRNAKQSQEVTSLKPNETSE